MERWSIEVEKAYHKFSAAHFLIFPDGSAERLHGHNYRVYVAIEAALTRFGLVLDFTMVKPLIRELADELDEHWLVPGEHAELRHERVEGGAIEVRYRERVYRAPVEDVLVLPINNTSAENLATWFGRELAGRLERRFEGLCLERLRVAVEESEGQRGVYEFTREALEGRGDGCGDERTRAPDGA